MESINSRVQQVPCADLGSPWLSWTSKSSLAVTDISFGLCLYDVSIGEIVIRGDSTATVPCSGDIRNAAASHEICSANSDTIYGPPTASISQKPFARLEIATLRVDGKVSSIWLVAKLQELLRYIHEQVCSAPQRKNLTSICSKCPSLSGHVCRRYAATVAS